MRQLLRYIEKGLTKSKTISVKSTREVVGYTEMEEGERYLNE